MDCAETQPMPMEAGHQTVLPSDSFPVSCLSKSDATKKAPSKCCTRLALQGLDGSLFQLDRPDDPVQETHHILVATPNK